MKKTIFTFVLLTSILFGRNTFANPDSLAIAANMKFSVQDVNGTDANFSGYLGKGPLLVNFWALWCEPCKQEMKAFVQLSDKLKDKGVSMVSINTDQVKSLAKVRAYVKTHGVNYPVLLDPDGAIARNQFSMESLPYSLILKPDGTVYKKHIGFTAGDEVNIEKELDELIAQLGKK
ncbi:MAG TPA: TlpA disulfide reductase family protein [Candidatus Kapabacteria bacterium]|nr:TlpA disulfide reductase family protein [Candidatus Kapabacteria bacterium]